ncbi:ANTAR domain-containing protein [Jatrophihabitans telluris]|uniref:ANTAR domain-containing protein n=1 Tax=Jatrophihabitans telluris TaxID=2038343 RepID=A0ABY4QWX6_9ACTN|nr:ANTAR domain-containing protein [Jatrophihabitans telluris]UQX87331.1 ANTAR domain-containing protein [Jatrophihabitans telluris]
MASDISQDLGRAEDVLGPRSDWPVSWHCAVQLCLEAAMPMSLGLGADLHLVYNQAYSDIAGMRHPEAFGRPLLEVWDEAEEILRPMLDQLGRDGTASAMVDCPLSLTRRGFLEECFFTFSLSPLRDPDGTITGVVNPTMETTKAVLARRRLGTISALAVAGRQSATVSEHLQAALLAVAGNPHDLPFALFYESGRASKRNPSLLGSVGLDGGLPVLVSALDDPESALRAMIGTVGDIEGPVVVTELDKIVPELSTGPWPEPATTALVIGLTPTKPGAPDLIMLGTSPRLQLDVDYRAFLVMVADQLQLDLGVVVAAEAERERATNLEIALETSRHIGAAIGILMGVNRITEEQAFQLLRETSQRSHRKLRDVADYVLETGSLPGGSVVPK